MNIIPLFIVFIREVVFELIQVCAKLLKFCYNLSILRQFIKRDMYLISGSMSLIYL